MKLEKFIELIGLTQLLHTFIIIAAVFLLAWSYTRLIGQIANRFPRYRLLLLSTVPIFRVSIWLIGLVLIFFWALALPDNLLLAVGASAALSFGLAVQDVLKSVLAGLVMLFQRPFALGDMVRIGEHYGEVVRMNIISVRLRTFDDDIVTVLNSKVFSEPIVNANTGELEEMVVITFNVLGSVDVDRVLDIAREAAICCPYVTFARPIVVMAEDATKEWHHSTQFKIRAYVNDLRCERIMATDIWLRTQQALRESGLLAEVSS